MPYRFQGKPDPCVGCGACCEFECYPPLTDAELRALPEPLQAETRLAIRSHDKRSMADKACTWWNPETQLCNHHDTHLPGVCGLFEVGGRLCLAYRSENPEYDTKADRVMRPEYIQVGTP